MPHRCALLKAGACTSAASDSLGAERSIVVVLTQLPVRLQCGIAAGVIQGAIDSMWAVEQPLGHVNQFLEDRPNALQAELDALLGRVMDLAKTPFDTSTEFFIDVLDTRAHGAELSLRAAQSALLHQGARGYLMQSDVQRRVRESHFVAIVTPAIKHLRKEMARLSAEVQPV